MSGWIALNSAPFPIGRQSLFRRLINGAIPITDFTYKLLLQGLRIIVTHLQNGLLVGAQVPTHGAWTSSSARTVSHRTRYGGGDGLRPHVVNTLYIKYSL